MALQFLLTYIFSFIFINISFAQTPEGNSTITIGEPSISASTGEVIQYQVCGMVSHKHTNSCQIPSIYHPVTSEWKYKGTVDIRISTVASGYGKVRGVLEKVIINGVYK